MMKSCLAYAAAILLMAGCASVQNPVAPVRQEPQQPAVHTVQILENPAAEYPAMCMLLQSDGSLQFRGGFAFYNPSAWRRVDQNTLIITLGGSGPFAVDVYKDQLPKRIGGLTAYDEKRRELVYHFDAKAEFLNFGNFYFYRSETCHAS